MNDILLKLLHFLHPCAFSAYFEGELKSLSFSLISACINKGENVSHKPPKGGVCCWECIHLRDCICWGGVVFELLLLDVLSLCLFLRTSCGLLGCVEPLPMSLGTKSLQVLLTSNDLVLGFSLAFGHLGSFFFPSLLLLLYLCGLCVGVDNALIKGEIADTWLICAHVVLCDEWLLTWFLSWVELVN